MTWENIANENKNSYKNVKKNKMAIYVTYFETSNESTIHRGRLWARITYIEA